MSEWFMNIKTKIYFGENILESSLQKENEIVNQNIMIVTTGNSLIRLGYLDKLVEVLKNINENKNIIVFDKISQNPQLEEIKQAVKIGKQEKIKAIIGFGGGSSIDSAKAIAVGIASDENIDEYYFNDKTLPENTLPIIAIPTTAGTGSELSRASIISCKEENLKKGIRGEEILPSVAIVDYSYTYSIPSKITMETGFDALSHGIESYLAVKSNEFTKMISETVIKNIGEHLPLLYQDLDNKKSRELLAFSSMIAGINLANAGTCFPHRMQYVIATLTETNHAEGLIALYPSWIKYQYKVNKDKVNNVLNWLDQKSATNEEYAKEYFINYLNSIGVKNSLSDLGVNKSDLDSLESKVTGDLTNDLLSKQNGILDKIFKESY